MVFFFKPFSVKLPITSYVLFVRATILFAFNQQCFVLFVYMFSLALFVASRFKFFLCDPYLSVGFFLTYPILSNIERLLPAPPILFAFN